MFPEELLEQIADDVKESVYYDTGISIDVEDMSLDVSGNVIVLKIWGNEFARLECKEGDMDCSPMDIAIMMMEGLDDDVKRKVVGLKILQLEEQSLPKLEQVVKGGLTGEGIKQDILDGLDFSIEDMGYDHHHWDMADDAEQGYPFIALAISSLDGLDFNYPMNIYYPGEPVDDMADLVGKLYSELGRLGNTDS